MSAFIAALPMYDWPEVRSETDARWAALAGRLRAAGVDAPAQLVRRNADMPAVPGGIRDAAGAPIAPDPATLPPDGFDVATLWRHPRLLVAQTCWGPMEATGLAAHVGVVGQPDYSAFEGGAGPFYSSAILMRRGEADPVAAPAEGGAVLPLERLRGRRLAFNETASMSGLIALSRDLVAAGESLDIFGDRLETGGHRASIVAVAAGRSDICAVDCQSWLLAKRFEPAAADIVPVGWTARRPGLPYISAAALAPLHARIAGVLAAGGPDQPFSRASSG
ncbi:MAG: PhnD/SsuA/transferrin family substrate-binding protein [Nitratireductor sp.]